MAGKLRETDTCPFCLRKKYLFETKRGWGCDQCGYYLLFGQSDYLENKDTVDKAQERYRLTQMRQ